jgi:hypothetical protein
MPVGASRLADSHLPYACAICPTSFAQGMSIAS